MLHTVKMYDRDLIKRVDQWPYHPFLPVKHYPPREVHYGEAPEMGVLCAYDKFFQGTSKVVTIHLIGLLQMRGSRDAYKNAPIKEYDDVYSFLGDGWRVD